MEVHLQFFLVERKLSLGVCVVPGEFSFSFQWHAASLVHCVSSGINRPEESAISQENSGPCCIARLTIRTATPFFSVEKTGVLSPKKQEFFPVPMLAIS